MDDLKKACTSLKSITSSNFHVSLQETVESGTFIGAWPILAKQQSMTMLWQRVASLEFVCCACFLCFFFRLCGILSFGDFKSGKFSAGKIIPPPSLLYWTAHSFELKLILPGRVCLCIQQCVGGAIGHAHYVAVAGVF